MDIITVKKASVLWKITARRVRELCRNGYIDGAYKIGISWVMPADTKKPEDRRITSGKYIGVKRRRKPRGSNDDNG